MKFDIINNHIIVSILTDNGLKKCIFDSGCPFTYFFDKSKEYFIERESHFVSSNPVSETLAASKSGLDKMVGVAVDGLIGTECFKDKNVLIDFPNTTITITPDALDNAFNVPMSDRYGLPILDICVNGKIITAAYDTGAMWSFVSTAVANNLGLVAVGQTLKEYNPIFGHFDAMLNMGEIRVGETDLGNHIVATCQTYDRILQVLNVDAFLGNEALRKAVVGISYIENRMGAIV